MKCTICNINDQEFDSALCESCEDKIILDRAKKDQNKYIGLNQPKLWEIAKFIIETQKESELIPEADKAKVDWKMLEGDWLDWLEERLLPCK